MEVCNDEATRQGIQGLLPDHALQDFQYRVPAAIPRTQEEDAGMTARREAADIGKVQVQRDEEPAFRNRPLPDHGIGCAAESLVSHTLGREAYRLQEGHMRLR
jgi:hypothetical protein